MISNFIQQDNTLTDHNHLQFKQIQSKSLSPHSKTQNSFFLEHKKLKVIDNILLKPYKLDTKALCKVVELGIKSSLPEYDNMRQLSPIDRNFVSKVYKLSPCSSSRPYSPLKKYTTPTSKLKYQKYIEILKPIGSEITLNQNPDEQAMQNFEENFVKSQKKVNDINAIKYQNNQMIRVRTFQAPQNINKLLKEPENQICRYLPFLEQSYQESQKIESQDDKKLVYIINDDSVISKYVKQALDKRSEFWIDANQSTKKRTPIFKQLIQILLRK